MSAGEAEAEGLMVALDVAARETLTSSASGTPSSPLDPPGGRGDGISQQLLILLQPFRQGDAAEFRAHPCRHHMEPVMYWRAMASIIRTGRVCTIQTKVRDVRILFCPPAPSP